MTWWIALVALAWSVTVTQIVTVTLGHLKRWTNSGAHLLVGHLAWGGVLGGVWGQFLVAGANPVHAALLTLIWSAILLVAAGVLACLLTLLCYGAGRVVAGPAPRLRRSGRLP